MMRLLVDACISKFAVDELRKAKHDVIWMPEEGIDPGDSEILNRAFHDDLILVTADKDFGALVFVFQEPHPTIVRLVNFKATEQGRIVIKVLNQYEEIFDRKPVLSIDRKRIRIKYPE